MPASLFEGMAGISSHGLPKSSPTEVIPYGGHPFPRSAIFDYRRTNLMLQRRTGYCPVCDANVVHGRIFQSRLAWRLDHLIGSIPARWNVGPWRCVDCDNRQMFIRMRKEARRSIEDNAPRPSVEQPEVQRVGNVLKTEHSLAHAAHEGDRFSVKYRMGVVQKLLDGKSTMSAVCRELKVSELEIQRWMKSWFESELARYEVLAGHNTSSDFEPIPGSEPDTDDDLAAARKFDWGADPESVTPSRIIEVEVIRRDK